MHNYLRKGEREVQHCAIHAPIGAPSWVHDRAQLWNTVETGENRRNSQLAREVTLGPVLNCEIGDMPNETDVK